MTEHATPTFITPGSCLQFTPSASRDSSDPGCLVSTAVLRPGLTDTSRAANLGAGGRPPPSVREAAASPPTRRAGEDIRGGRLPPASWRPPAETPRARPSSPECLKKDAHGCLFWGPGAGRRGKEEEGARASPEPREGSGPDPGLPQDGGRHAAALARRRTLWPAGPPAQRAEAKRGGHPTILAR